MKNTASGVNRHARCVAVLAAFQPAATVRMSNARVAAGRVSRSKRSKAANLFNQPDERKVLAMLKTLLTILPTLLECLPALADCANAMKPEAEQLAASIKAEQ